MSSENTSPFNFFTGTVLGIILGMILGFVFFIWPQQRLIQKKDELVSEMADFNLREQQRLADMRHIEESQLRKWVAQVEDYSRRYQEIQATLSKLEHHYSDPGKYWIYLMIIGLFAVVGYGVWAFKQESVKDQTTLDNFKTVISEYLRADQLAPAEEFERARIMHSKETLLDADDD